MLSEKKVDALARRLAGAVSLKLRELTTGLLAVEFRVYSIPGLSTWLGWQIVLIVTYTETVNLGTVRRTVDRVVMTERLRFGVMDVEIIVRHPGEVGDIEESLWWLGGTQ